ncbi:MAG: hypothetical protein K8R21_05680, partial [Leptospira sp.]|nr:hypothetical protein [Leptospira sp.]
SNKTGVYNSDHTAAYLPLISGDLLFGFLKISFQTETHNFEFSGLWKEIQKFSDHLTEFRNYYLAIHNPTTGIFNYYHFLGTLRSKSNESRTGNITLIKIGLTGDAGIAIEKLSAGLLSLFGEDFPVYQISDDTLGFFPDAVQLEKLQNSLGEIFSQMSSYSSRMKMWVGSADMNTSYHSAEKWLSKAHNALSQAIDAGPNNFKLFANK